MALNHVLRVPEYSRRSQLQESCLNIFHLPIFDRFMAYRRSEKNFGPNVIYCFLGFNGNKRKHKFHGLVGPPAGIFEENNNLQNQEESFRFLRMALNHVLIAQRYSRHSQLQESCLNIFHLPIFDRFMAYRRSRKNFGPNVVYCFFGDHTGGDL